MQGFLTVHCVLGAREELDQGPEGVFLVHVHEEQGCDLTHPLAVPNFLRKGEQTAGFKANSMNIDTGKANL